MKLFRDKERGPKIKSEDVIIPEEYLEYEREAEARKQRERSEQEVQKKAADEDPLAIRVENLLNASKQALQEQKASASYEKPDVTIGEVVETLEEMMPEPDAAPTVDDSEPMDLEEALRAEKERSNYEARMTRRRKEKTSRKPDKPAGESKAKAKKNNEVPTVLKVLFVAIVLVVATVVVLLGPIMTINEVQVNDLNNMTEAQVEEIAGHPVGQNLFRYDASQAEEELRYYPYVQDVKISRHWPHWLEIHITERKPVGVLLNNGNYLQFSADGVLLDNTASLTDQNLPLITGFSMTEVPSPGEAFQDNERFSDALKIVNACSDDLLGMIQEINIKDRNNILAYTSQGLEIRIGNVDNIKDRMAILNDIMNQVILSDIVEEPIEAIDIRYEKSPVIVLEGYDNIDVSNMINNEETGEQSDQNTQAADDQTGGQNASQTTDDADDTNTSDNTAANGSSNGQQGSSGTTTDNGSVDGTQSDVMDDGTQGTTTAVE